MGQATPDYHLAVFSKLLVDQFNIDTSKQCRFFPAYTCIILNMLY